MSSQALDDHHSNGIHFFKVILESCLQDGQLRVPRSFTSKHWQGMSNPVFLRLPNRIEWKVYWMKRDGHVWFCNGWKEFAEYLSLDVSQFVLFRYEENSCFNVIVFDKSALEIKYPSRGTDEEGEKVDKSDYSLKILEDGSPLEGKRPTSSSPSSQTSKKIKTNPSEEDAGFDNAKHINSGNDKDLKERIKTFHEKVKKNFRSENDFFTCAIQESYASRDLMIIPKEFSKSHLHKMQGQQKATLFVDQDLSWVVDLKLNFSGQSLFTGGWRKFFMENKLKLGDVCAFVPQKSKGVSFQVLIFPLEKDSSTPLFQDSEKSNMGQDKFEIFLKPCYLQSYPNIPNQFMKRHRGCHKKFAELKVGETSWYVKMVYYPNYCSGRFTEGWRAFVRRYKLKVGDICLFELINEERLVFKVSISRSLED